MSVDKETKNKWIALSIAIATTLLVFVVWITVLIPKYTQNPQEQKVEIGSGPLDTFSGYVVRVMTNVGEGINDVIGGVFNRQVEYQAEE